MAKDKDDKAPVEDAKTPEAATEQKELTAELRTAPVIESRESENRKRDIMAIAPDSHRELAEQCILEGLTVEESRTRMLAERTKQQEPAGTETTDALKTGGETKREEATAGKVDAIPDRDFKRALCGN